MPLWIALVLLAALAGCGDGLRQAVQTRLVGPDRAITGTASDASLTVQIDLADSRGLQVQTISPNITAAVARLSGPLLNDPPRSQSIPVASFSPTPAQVSTLAGSGVAGYADGTGTAAQFRGPAGVAVDSTGTVYVADQANHRIRKVTSAGVVTTFAGSGTAGSADGTGIAAQFNGPTGVAVNSNGTVYVGDESNSLIRQITPAGVVTTLAGSPQSFSYADGTGISARFNSPRGIALDNSGNLYVADVINNRIRKVTSVGVVTTFAGSGTQGYLDGTGTSAQFNNPGGVTVDSNGNVYVADSGNNRIRKIDPNGVVTTLAGNATAGFADGAGTAAQFNGPNGIAIGSSGNVYVADSVNQRIRKITAAGVVTTIAGNGTAGFADGTGTNTQFSNPFGITVDSSGNVYVADQSNQRIRMITPPSRLATGVFQSLRPGAGYKLEVALYDNATPANRVLASGDIPGTFALAPGTNTVTVVLKLTGAVNLDPKVGAVTLLTNNVVTTGNRILVSLNATDSNSQLRMVRLWLDGTTTNNYTDGQLLATWFSDALSNTFDWNTGATIKTAIIGTPSSPPASPTPNPFVSATPTPPHPLAFNKLPFTGGITARNADTGGAAAWSSDHNKMYVWAFHTAGSASTAEFWAYSVVSDSWLQLSIDTIAARGTSIAYDDTNQRIYLYGGWNGSSNFNDLFAYNPTTDSWLAKANGPAGRRNHSMIWDSNFFRLYVFGGITGTFTNDLLNYNPASDTWSTVTTGSSPPARAEHAAVWDSNSNKMYIYGGTGSSGLLNDAWAYTPASPTSGTWTQLPVSGITARTQASAVWDPVRRRMIVCGGQTSGGFVNECWNFTPVPGGGSWTQLTVPDSLAARGNHYMAWDTLNNRMLLYGGANGNPNVASNLFNDLWSFGPQPSDLVAAPAAVATPAPANHTLTFSLHDRFAPPDQDLIRVLTYKFTVAQ